MEKTDRINPYGLEIYSNFIDEGIKNTKTIKIHWYNTNEHPSDVPTTVTRQPRKNSNVINIYIVEDDGLKVLMQDGSDFSPSMARKLLHELSGHGVTWVMRATTEGGRVGNAIAVENIIINKIYKNTIGKDAPPKHLRKVKDDRWYDPGI